jgi:uncharacterized protein
MKALIEYIVSNIVNHPEAVIVTESQVEEGLTKYTIEVDPEDVGRVIGKQGKVIKSIRQIVRVSAIQKGLRVIVDLKEDERSRASDTGSTDDLDTQTTDLSGDLDESTDEITEDTIESPEVTSEEVVEEVADTEVPETPETTEDVVEESPETTEETTDDTKSA